MKIIDCLHTAILVSDLEKAEHFYGNVLGLTKVERVLKFPGCWYQIGNYQIHLMVQANLTKTPPKGEKWGRNPHIAFAVTDINQAIIRLQTQGYPIQMSNSGRPALFTQDPDGNIIEISQG